jgi:hypothetical protein
MASVATDTQAASTNRMDPRFGVPARALKPCNPSPGRVPIHHTNTGGGPMMRGPREGWRRPRLSDGFVSGQSVDRFP